jgi:ribokinase
MNEFLCTLIGDIMWDILCSTQDSQFSYSGVTEANYIKMEPGGIGNTAVGLSFLGKKAVLIGKIGDDTLGKLCVDDLHENNIITKIFTDNYTPTGALISIIDDTKERSFLVNRGANDKLNPSEIEKSITFINKSKYVYMNGYSLTTNKLDETFSTIINIANKYNKKIIFDPAAHNIIENRRNFINKILKNCDTITLNYIEAKTLTKKVNKDEIMDELLKYVNFVALKLGKKGCMIANKGKRIRIPGEKVQTVDTTGAGDAFNAAIIYGLSENFSLNKMGKLANWYASEVIKKYGARSYPESNTITEYLENI